MSLLLLFGRIPLSFVESGIAASDLQGSGADALVVAESGLGITGLRGVAADILSASVAGAAVGAWLASGADIYTPISPPESTVGGGGRIPLPMGYRTADRRRLLDDEDELLLMLAG